MKKPHQISVSADLFAKLKAEAEAQGTTMASIVEAAVASTLGHEPPPVRTYRRRQ